MRHLSPVLFSAVISLSFSAGKMYAQYPAQARIMTYNINAETHTDGDYTDIGDVIKTIKPNICGLQKVDSCSVTAKPVYVLKALGDQAGMVPTFSKSYAKNGGSYGNGFLSDSTPKSMRHLAIPKGSASEDRSALEIGVTMGGLPARIIVTHLDYGSAANRTTQLQQILTWINEGGPATDPVVIMADFNAQSTESSMKLLTDAGFAYVKTPGGVVLDTAQKINHILFRPESRWNITAAGNPAYSASNRYPLWADMKLLPPTSLRARNGDFQKPAATNIFFSGTGLSYNLVAPATVSLLLCDSRGRVVLPLIRCEHQTTGHHVAAMPLPWLPSGRYQGILTVDGQRIAKAIPIVR